MEGKWQERTSRQVRERYLRKWAWAAEPTRWADERIATSLTCRRGPGEGRTDQRGADKWRRSTLRQGRTWPPLQHWSRSLGPQCKWTVACQSREADLSASAEWQDKHRRLFFLRMFFKHKLGNGEHLPREWLCYSPLEDSVFSLPCKGFWQKQSPFDSIGCSNWKHASERNADHKSSEIHRKAMIVYTNQMADSRTMNSELIKTVNEECECWTRGLLFK